MKHHKSHHPAPNPAPPLVPVRFEFNHPTALTVAIAGSFNQWQPDTKPLRNSGTGRWWEEIALAPGTYEYCLVVDGKWMPDPRAQETVPNPFGGKNSVIKVAPPSADLSLSDPKGQAMGNAPKRKAQRL